MQQVKVRKSIREQLGTGGIVVGATIFPYMLLVMVVDSFNQQFGWWLPRQIVDINGWVAFYISQTIVIILGVVFAWAEWPYLKEMWKKKQLTHLEK